MEKTWFKKHQRAGIFHYYEVYGGAGRTENGYQVVVNFLNDFPIICTEHNYQSDPYGISGTWLTYAEGIPIAEEEYKQAYQQAIAHPQLSFR